MNSHRGEIIESVFQELGLSNTNYNMMCAMDGLYECSITTELNDTSPETLSSCRPCVLTVFIFNINHCFHDLLSQQVLDDHYVHGDKHGSNCKYKMCHLEPGNHG